MNDETKKRVGIVGLGAAACAVCCAGSILAVLAGLGLVGLASTLLIGGFGLIIATAIAAYVIIRCPRTSCAEPAAPVVVTAPARRMPQTTEWR